MWQYQLTNAVQGGLSVIGNTVFFYDEAGHLQAVTYTDMAVTSVETYHANLMAGARPIARPSADPGALADIFFTANELYYGKLSYLPNAQPGSSLFSAGRTRVPKTAI
jgi:hypothetical protein